LSHYWGGGYFSFVTERGVTHETEYQEGRESGTGYYKTYKTSNGEKRYQTLDVGWGIFYSMGKKKLTSIARK